MSSNGSSPARRLPSVSKPTRTDVSIMGTNDSSIVSKRSVERLYMPEPHFFRHFVKKPKRRSPLINRGYWLRMRAIEFELKNFLMSPNTKKKVVINLGCGYDPLPFQMLSKLQGLTRDVLFVDVDYLNLIENKVAMIRASVDLLDLLGKHEAPDAPNGLPFSSKQYVTVGCDLSNTVNLEMLLQRFLDLPECSFCFLAEVSITYMDDVAADNLIRWASGLVDARFCVLEQCLPWTATHPFAETMLKHFNKLGTRLRSLQNHPTVEDQELRFLERGWASASGQSLWNLWAKASFLSPEEREALDEIEPFDEWEDFALFANHYFILVASNQGKHPEGSHEYQINASDRPVAPMQSADSTQESRPDAGSPVVPPRSHGALFEAASGVFCLHAGHGSQARLSDSAFFSTQKQAVDSAKAPPLSTGGRKCHTITVLNARFDSLLVGGRTSPNNALRDCWLREEGTWAQVEGLPVGLYRHCATAISIMTSSSAGATESAVLVYGGKTGKAQFNPNWYLWRKVKGWTQLSAAGENVKPRFGSCIAQTCANGGSVHGFIVGGISTDGLVQTRTVLWNLLPDENCIYLTESHVQSHYPATARFGAVLIQQNATVHYLIGGMLESGLHPRDYEPIFRLETSPDGNIVTSRSTRHESWGPLLPQHKPLLTGHSAAYCKDGIFITGGGATCFSFGAYHNQSIWICGREKLVLEHSWNLAPKPESLSATPSSLRKGRALSPLRSETNLNGLSHMPSTIPIQIMTSNISIPGLLSAGEPKVLRGLDLGACSTIWSPYTLKQKVSTERLVTVHWSEHEVLDFKSKNFSYKKMPFGEFTDSISSGGKHYLRALSTQGTDKPADFWADWPEIADDFSLPPVLASYLVGGDADGSPAQAPSGSATTAAADNFRPEPQPGRIHSSVLRLSGPVAMWLHYDVMANVLCQIRGAKRLLLFPPADVTRLGVAPGQSSSSLNAFDPAAWAAHPELAGTTPYEARLLEGDVLFIPALWLHTAMPELAEGQEAEGGGGSGGGSGGGNGKSSPVSIAVNVFFRDLAGGYAAGRDAYGNRDLQPYEDGRRDLAKVVARFDRLPSAARVFYLKRLAQELDMAAAKE